MEGVKIVRPKLASGERDVLLSPDHGAAAAGRSELDRLPGRPRVAEPTGRGRQGAAITREIEKCDINATEKTLSLAPHGDAKADHKSAEGALCANFGS